jgi:predicted nucleotidyltransferase/DNA-binding XRE family transcriptional regulator
MNNSDSWFWPASRVLDQIIWSACAIFAHTVSAETVESLGRRIAEARREKGLSQGELAEAISLDRTAISKIERGRRNAGSFELARIARVLGRPLEWFLADTVAPQKPNVRDLRRRRRAILRIAASHGARSIRVFGSVARGESRGDSDVDLLVEMEPGRGLLDQAAMLVELRDLLGRDVDVVTAQGLRGRIRDRVLGEAVAL